MKHYEGVRLRGHLVVTVDGQELVPRYDLANHSPTGFEWGYGGSGPAQLALALLADCLGNDEQALELYQGFKRDVVALLPTDAWSLTEQDIRQALPTPGG